MNPNFNTNPDHLIHNPEFFEWVVRPTNELDEYWNQFISANPLRKDEVDEAIFIIKSIIPKERDLTDEAIHRLWNRIENDSKEPKKFIFHFSGWMAAASVFLLLGISGLFYFLNQSETSLIDYQAIAKIESLDNEVKLIFADKSEEILRSKNLDIKYDSNGEIIVNSEKLATQKLAESKSVSEQLNQLIVPRGKRTSLTLSDGTKMWLNSGSRAIFPVTFTKREREIFIEGEAYLEVAHNPSNPFVVVSNNIRVQVLGTKFNVSSYPDDAVASVVLVEGSVLATVASQKTLMKPNQLFTFENKSGLTQLKETDVVPFTSWKDGWMYCKKEKLETIATKLSRYYNIPIEFKDEQAKEMTLTGKLDLKTECAEIFKAISSTAPINFEIQNDIIVISSKSIN